MPLTTIGSLAVATAVACFVFVLLIVCFLSCFSFDLLACQEWHAAELQNACISIVGALRCLYDSVVKDQASTPVGVWGGLAVSQ
jgi:hypothetical protein